VIATADGWIFIEDLQKNKYRPSLRSATDDLYRKGKKETPGQGNPVFQEFRAAKTGTGFYRKRKK
jgi:hypothetical protein